MNHRHSVKGLCLEFFFKEWPKFNWSSNWPTLSILGHVTKNPLILNVDVFDLMVSMLNNKGFNDNLNKS